MTRFNAKLKWNEWERCGQSESHRPCIANSYYLSDCYYNYVLNAFVLLHSHIRMSSFWRTNTHAHTLTHSSIYTQSRLINRYAINWRFLWSAPVCWAPKNFQRGFFSSVTFLLCCRSIPLPLHVCVRMIIIVLCTLDALKSEDREHTAACICWRRVCEGTQMCVLNVQKVCLCGEKESVPSTSTSSAGWCRCVALIFFNVVCVCVCLWWLSFNSHCLPFQFNMVVCVCIVCFVCCIHPYPCMFLSSKAMIRSPKSGTVRIFLALVCTTSIERATQKLFTFQEGNAMKTEERRRRKDY